LGYNISLFDFMIQIEYTYILMSRKKINIFKSLNKCFLIKDIR